MRYFGASVISDDQPQCAAAETFSSAPSISVSPPREIVVQLPHFDDYRGGGLRLRFVSNPRKPGGAYGVAALPI